MEMSNAGQTKQQHTPGPWVIEFNSDIMGCGELLASVYPMKRDGIHNSWKGNAELIASAPLLEERVQALEKAFARYKSHDPKCPEFHQKSNRFNGGAVYDTAFSCNCGLAEAERVLGGARK